MRCVCCWQPCFRWAFKRHKWLERTNSFEIVLNGAKWDFLPDSLHITFVQTVLHLCLSLCQWDAHTERGLVSIRGDATHSKALFAVSFVFHFYNVSPFSPPAGGKISHTKQRPFLSCLFKWQLLSNSISPAPKRPFYSAYPPLITPTGWMCFCRRKENTRRHGSNFRVSLWGTRGDEI